jgi:peptide/nickel transport system permease protein
MNRSEAPGRPPPSPLLPSLLVLTYLAAAAGVWFSLWGQDWAAISGGLREPPSWEHWLGTNRLGQDVFDRLLAATATAFEVGLVVAISAVAIGTLIGGVAGYRPQGRMDAVLTWLMGTIDAVPFYLFVATVAIALDRMPGSLQLAMALSFWTLTARIVRTETMRIMQREFVAAARVGGSRPGRILVRHVLPHLAPLLLVQVSLVFVAAIKAEVVLSFLGIGSQDSISWGIMIAEAAQEILAGHYTNFVAASLALFVLVLSINRLTDRLGQRLDPSGRRRGRRHADSTPTARAL